MAQRCALVSRVFVPRRAGALLVDETEVKLEAWVRD